MLVVYDNPGIDAISPMVASYPRPEGEGLVFGPHYYDIGLFSGGDWSGLPPEDVIARMASFRDANGVPVLLGEFGYAGGAGKGAAEWLTRLMDAIDGLRLSATLWEYSVSEELWNGEDLSVVTAQGQERPVLEVYVRPWLRAVAGTDASFRWDAGTGLVEAAWTSSGGVTEIVAPVRLFPDGPVNLSLEGDGACATWDPERGEVRVRAPAGVSVRVTFRGGDAARFRRLGTGRRRGIVPSSSTGGSTDGIQGMPDGRRRARGRHAGSRAGSRTAC